MARGTSHVRLTVILVAVSIIVIAVTISIITRQSSQGQSNATSTIKSTEQCVDQYNGDDTSNKDKFLCIAKQIDRIEQRLNMSYSEK